MHHFEQELKPPRGTTQRTRVIRATEASAHSGGKHDIGLSLPKGTTAETREHRARITGAIYFSKGKKFHV
jgi:hypothetical protein